MSRRDIVFTTLLNHAQNRHLNNNAIWLGERLPALRSRPLRPQNGLRNQAPLHQPLLARLALRAASQANLLHLLGNDVCFATQMI